MRWQVRTYPPRPLSSRAWKECYALWVLAAHIAVEVLALAGTLGGRPRSGGSMSG